LSAYAVTAFNYYNNSTSCSQILSSKFCSFSLTEVPYTSIDQLFLSANPPSTLAIQDIIYKVATNISNYKTDDNSLINITQPNIINDFISDLYAVELINWQTRLPLTYLHLARDSLLSPYNTITAFNKVKAQSADGLVNKIEIKNDDYAEGTLKAPIDHNNPIQYIVALSVFNHYFN
jgi:hypothetical protein